MIGRSCVGDNYGDWMRRSLPFAILYPLVVLALPSCATATKNPSGGYNYTGEEIQQNEAFFGTEYEAPPYQGSAVYDATAATAAGVVGLLQSGTYAPVEGPVSPPDIPHIDGVCQMTEGGQRFPCAGITLILID